MVSLVIKAVEEYRVLGVLKVIEVRKVRLEGLGRLDLQGELEAKVMMVKLVTEVNEAQKETEGRRV